MFKGLSVAKNCLRPDSVPLKKTKAKLDLLTDIYMLLMVEKGIRGGICHAIHWFAEANNKYMKNYQKKKESSYLKYWL